MGMPELNRDYLKTGVAGGIRNPADPNKKTLMDRLVEFLGIKRGQGEGQRATPVDPNNQVGMRPGMFTPSPERAAERVGVAGDGTPPASSNAMQPSVAQAKPGGGTPAWNKPNTISFGGHFKSPSMQNGRPAWPHEEKAGAEGEPPPAPAKTAPPGSIPKLGTPTKAPDVNPKSPQEYRGGVLEKYKEMMKMSPEARQNFATEKGVIEEIRGMDRTFFNPHTKKSYGTSLEAALGVGKALEQRNYATEKALQMQGLKNKGLKDVAEVRNQPDDLLGQSPHMEDNEGNRTFSDQDISVALAAIQAIENEEISAKEKAKKRKKIIAMYGEDPNFLEEMHRASIAQKI
jgi:hypothetical protein